ncbi:MAG: glycine zipper 2TM domain-containing protein [Proteobacteria bacterium]|nr:glycine zipper 2TM domain-containing protein [Pseudomonadota bacterium]
MPHSSPHRRASTLRSALIAAMAVSFIASAPAGTAFADPPPWAPAHGYRAKYQYPDIDIGTCNRGLSNSQLVGGALGAIVGGLLGSKVGKGKGKLAATAAGTLLGALAGASIAQSMDTADNECVRKALDAAPDQREVAWRNPDADAQYDETSDPYIPVKGWKAAPDPADVTSAVELLLNAKDPLIYAGEGVIYAGASAELKSFVELVNTPVITTLKAKGCFPENHPLFVGVRGDQVNHYLNKCDLLLAVGSSLSPGRFSHGIPNAVNKTIIHCNIDELHVNKVYPTALALIGDARLTLMALTAEVSAKTSGNGRPAGNVASEVKSARESAMVKYREAMASTDKPINPYRVYAGLMEALDPLTSFVTHESGNTRDQLSTVYDTLVPRGFLGWGNVSSLGFSLAATVAAKLAFPQKQCVAVTGEAGLGYMFGNLEVPLRQKLGITVAHVSNGGFAGYGPGFWGDGHDPFTHKVLGYDEVDMSKVIGELGYHTERVTEPSEVVLALKRAFSANESGQPAYIEFICSQYPIYGGWVAK